MKGHGVVYVVVCAAPPAQHIHELVSLLCSDQRQVIVFATPTAAEWINGSLVRDLTGAPVRSVPRSVDEPRTQPAPDAVVVAPATFNTINKWAAGINDNAAMGVLNEAIGQRLPVIASAYAKESLAAHPAFARSLQTLEMAGVTLTATNALKAEHPSGRYRWHEVVQLLDAATA